MKQTFKTFVNVLHPKRINDMVQYLLRDEAISGKIILVAIAAALVLVNSPLKWAYDAFWATELSIGIGSWALSLDLLHWVNDGLMAIFFLVVGLEIKREFIKGRLRDRRAAILPIFAAIGGMVVPALVYAAFNYGLPTIRGWAIPTATDIALAVGLITLLGRRAPTSLKLLLLTIAIVDDIGSIAVIALFYTTSINATALLVSGGIMLLIYALRRQESIHGSLFALLGICLWISVKYAGIHPSIAGTLLGFLAPIESTAKNRPSRAERVERKLIPISTFIVVPIFVLANMGIEFNLSAFDTSILNARIFWGILFGLLVGKVVGVVLSVGFLVYFKAAKLPEYVNWAQIIGVGFLAGVGFTVSTFITNLAFFDPSRVAAAKAGVFVASALSAILGLLALYFSHVHPKDHLPKHKKGAQ